MASASALAMPVRGWSRQSSSRPSINAARLRNRLERLSTHGRPAGGTFADGVSRVAYSVADLTARGLTLLRTGIGNRAGFAHAFAQGLGITEAAPRSTGARELRALLDEVMELIR